MRRLVPGLASWVRPDDLRALRLHHGMPQGFADMRGGVLGRSLPGCPQGGRCIRGLVGRQIGPSTRCLVCWHRAYCQGWPVAGVVHALSIPQSCRSPQHHAGEGHHYCFSRRRAWGEHPSSTHVRPIEETCARGSEGGSLSIGALPAFCRGAEAEIQAGTLDPATIPETPRCQSGTRDRQAQEARPAEGSRSRASDLVQRVVLQTPISRQGAMPFRLLDGGGCSRALYEVL